MRTSLTVEFRVIFGSILVAITLVGVLLTFFAGSTEVYWAWVTDQPRSAILIGAGYLGAAIYIFIVLRTDDWLQVRSGLGGFVVYSFAFLVATSLHWDQFRPYQPTTFLYLIFYYVGPVFVPIVSRIQRERMPAPAASGPLISPGWRTFLIVRGFLYFALALIGLIFADWFVTYWPWPIHALELRVFTAQVATVGWGAVVALREGRLWVAQRLGLVFTGAIGAMQLIWLFIGPGGYDWGSVGGILLALMFVEWVVTPVAMYLTYYRKQ